MNKYEEALDYVRYQHSNMEGYTIKEGKYHECVENLSKLVEKATPKKVKETDIMFACPECGQMLSMKYHGLCIECIKGIHYCPNCGQKLDWSEV